MAEVIVEPYGGAFGPRTTIRSRLMTGAMAYVLDEHGHPVDLASEAWREGRHSSPAYAERIKHMLRCVERLEAAA